MKLFIIFSTIIILSGCASLKTKHLPDSFTQDNMMKIHQGMSSKEIVNMFGKPKNISQSICGTNTGRSWTCTTWEYGQFPYDRASFTFSGESPDNLILNHFSIDMD